MIQQSILKNHRQHVDHHRSGGIASFMRIPIAEPPKSEGELDVVFLGIPLDTATSNRPGARYPNLQKIRDHVNFL